MIAMARRHLPARQRLRKGLLPRISQNAIREPPIHHCIHAANLLDFTHRMNSRTATQQGLFQELIVTKAGACTPSCASACSPADGAAGLSDTGSAYTYAANASHSDAACLCYLCHQAVGNNKFFGTGMACAEVATVNAKVNMINLIIVSSNL